MKRLFLCAPALWLIALMIGSPAFGQPYVGVDFFTMNAPLSISPTFLPSWAAGGQVIGTSGYIAMTGPQNPILWVGPMGTFTDLTPPGLSAGVLSTDGLHQVGSAGDHAYVWNGTAESGVDIHPNNLRYPYSAAFGVHGNQQVGSGLDSTFRVEHALVWQGTPDSAMDLHPGSRYESKQSLHAFRRLAQPGYVDGIQTQTIAGKIAL